MNFISSGSFVIVLNPKGQAGFLVNFVMLFDILQKYYHNKLAYFLNLLPFIISALRSTCRYCSCHPTVSVYVVSLLLSIVGNCKLWRWVDFQKNNVRTKFDIIHIRLRWPSRAETCRGVYFVRVQFQYLSSVRAFC